MAWLSKSALCSLALSFVCISLTGCAEPGESTAQKRLALQTELVQTLESIQDVKTCEAAIPKVERISKDIAANNEEIRSLQLSTEQLRFVNEKYNNNDNEKRLQDAATKLGSLEESSTELKTQIDRLLEALKPANYMKEPAKTTAETPETAQATDKK